MKNKALKVLTESAVMIAIATVLSLFKVDMPYGGGLTLCSMLPLVVIAFRHGTGVGVLSAFAYSVLQMVLGLDNVAYGQNALQVVAIIALDYIVAYTVIGFAGVFGNRQSVYAENDRTALKQKYTAIVLGITVTFAARFLCHLVSGAMIWDALWPNEYGLAPWIYSLVYNGCYMLPEIIITSLVSVFICKYDPKIFARQYTRV